MCYTNAVGKVDVIGSALNAVRSGVQTQRFAKKGPFGPLCLVLLIHTAKRGRTQLARCVRARC